MSVRAIFQNLLHELDYLVINSSENTSLLVLSQVSKNAQIILDNSFFRERFFTQHPHLEKCRSKLFTVLCQDHSDNCWKVICKLFPAQRKQRDFTCDPVENFNRLKISLLFFARAIPAICSSLQLQKVYYESRIKEISAPAFQKSNKVREQSMHEYRSLQKKREEGIKWTYMPNYSDERFVGILKDEIQKIDRNLSFFSNNFLPGSLEMVQLLEKFGDYYRYFEAIQSEQKLFDEYQCLVEPQSGSDEDENLNIEPDQGYIEERLEPIREQLSRLRSILPGDLSLYCKYLALFTEQQRNIQNEFGDAFNLEQSKMHDLHLKECLNLIDEASKQPTGDIVQRISSLINSFGRKEKTHIYTTLCSAAAPEDREKWFDSRLSVFYPQLEEETILDECIDSGPFQNWFESHVSKYLPELKKIVESHLHRYCEVSKKSKIRVIA